MGCSEEGLVALWRSTSLPTSWVLDTDFPMNLAGRTWSFLGAVEVTLPLHPGFSFSNF